ncbi:MAG: flavodoxin [Dysgonamonadaceae bacterium]|jgi:flavodoxin I|nr:flavodoxin [Dysgonamonadaceae bacterium]
MNKIGIFYGSSGGNTQNVAKTIAKKLNVSDNDVYNVAKAGANDLIPYEILLLGSSTWGYGDLQDDWESFIKIISSVDLTNKKIALFGCGDSSSYPDTFCSAMGIIYKTVSKKAEIIGLTGTDGYSFDDSEAIINGQFAGLAIDEDNESNLTEERINNWVEALKKAI